MLFTAYVLWSGVGFVSYHVGWLHFIYMFLTVHVLCCGMGFVSHPLGRSHYIKMLFTPHVLWSDIGFVSRPVGSLSLYFVLQYPHSPQHPSTTDHSSSGMQAPPITASRPRLLCNACLAVMESVVM